MATLSEISDPDSGILSSEATPEIHTTPTSSEDKVISDKKEVTSEAALEELVSSAVTATSQEIQQPKQTSVVSSSVLNDEDEDIDENYEMIPEHDSDLSIITSEENTPTRDIKDVNEEESKGEADKIIQETVVPCEAVQSHESVEDKLTNVSLIKQEEVIDNVGVSAVTIDSQEVAKDVVVSTVTVTSAEVTLPVNDTEVDDVTKEDESMSLGSYSVISEILLDDDKKNVESVMELAQEGETLNESSQNTNLINDTIEDEALNESSQEADAVKLDQDSKINSSHGVEAIKELAKEAEVISESDKVSESVNGLQLEKEKVLNVDSLEHTEAIIVSDQDTEKVEKPAQDAENISKSSQDVENISELNQEAEISGIAQDDQSTPSLSTTVSKVEQEKDIENYEMIADPDSGVATPESMALTPTSEEVVVVPPVEKKEEVKEEVIEQIITSGVAAAVAAAPPPPTSVAATAVEPKSTTAAKEITVAETVTPTKAATTIAAAAAPAPPTKEPATTAAATAPTKSTATTAAETPTKVIATTSNSSKTIAKSEEKAKEQSKPSTSSVSSSTATIAKVDTANELDDDDDDDIEDLDESLSERIWGLTEMFPESLRSGSINTVTGALGFIKGTYEMSRSVVWIAVSSSLLLFAPVMFELERINVEEMMKQDRNRLVLGPGSAMSGPPVPGLMPGPAPR